MISLITILKSVFDLVLFFVKWTIPYNVRASSIKAREREINVQPNFGKRQRKRERKRERVREKERECEREREIERDRER